MVIDISGLLGYRMQIKIDFLRRDSILAALLVLDLAYFEQLIKVQNTIRRIIEEGLVTHLDLEDYQVLAEIL